MEESYTLREAHNNIRCILKKTDYLDKKAKNIKKFQKSIAIMKKM